MVAARNKLLRSREEAGLSVRAPGQRCDFEAVIADLMVVTRPYWQIGKTPGLLITLAEAVGSLPECLVGFPAIGFEADQTKGLLPLRSAHQKYIQSHVSIHVLRVHEDARPLGRGCPRLSKIILATVRGQHI